MTMSTNPMMTLRANWQRMREEEPALRAPDLAERLGVSEAELVASRCGDGVVRLAAPWAGLIEGLPALGKVMALTRNAHCVHEKTGVYDHIEIGGAMGIVLAGDIDLRLFLRHWRFGFAVSEISRGRLLESLQFFDGDGRAVHKIHMTDHSDRKAWRELVLRHTDVGPSSSLQMQAVEEPLPWRQPDDKVDVDALRGGWRALGDPHDFFALLRKHRVTRTQALRLVGAPFARPVSPAAIGALLDMAVAREVPLMVFVGSPGVVQIHTGPVRTVKTVGPWLNVLDEGFNLHLRADRVAEAWVVRKPVPEGEVTSLELYDDAGLQILQVFGKRKPGIPEREDWRELLAALDTVEKTDV
jgi:putative hemin transport protein